MDVRGYDAVGYLDVPGYPVNIFQALIDNAKEQVACRDFCKAEQFLELAKKQALHLADDYDQSKALKEIAEVYVKYSPEKARELLCEIPGENYADATMERIFVKLGRDPCEYESNNSGYSEVRFQALIEGAIEQANYGNIHNVDKILRWAEREVSFIQENDDRSTALKEIGKVHIRTGHIEKARRILCKIPDENYAEATMERILAELG